MISCNWTIYLKNERLLDVAIRELDRMIVAGDREVCNYAASRWLELKGFIAEVDGGREYWRIYPKYEPTASGLEWISRHRAPKGEW